MNMDTNSFNTEDFTTLEKRMLIDLFLLHEYKKIDYIKESSLEFKNIEPKIFFGMFFYLEELNKNSIENIKLKEFENKSSEELIKNYGSEEKAFKRFNKLHRKLVNFSNKTIEKVFDFKFQNKEEASSLIKLNALVFFEKKLELIKEIS